MRIVLLMLLVLLAPATGLCQNEERVLKLPELGSKWFVTAVYSSKVRPSKRDKELAATLRNELATLVSQVNFNEWDDSDRFVRHSKWNEYLGTNRPALVLQHPSDQDGNGKVVFFASGPHLKTGAELAKSLQRAVESHMNDCPRCPRPVTPEPVRPVEPVKPIPVIVPEEPEPVSPPSKHVPVVFLLLPFVAAGLRVYQELHKKES